MESISAEIFVGIVDVSRGQEYLLVALSLGCITRNQTKNAHLRTLP
jgi:hypothetical protein